MSSGKMKIVYSLILCLVLLLSAVALTGCKGHVYEPGAYENGGFDSFDEMLAAAKEDGKPVLLFLSKPN